MYLNGRCGVITGYDADRQRFAVLIDGREQMTSLKPECCRAMVKDSAE
jgi:hypothetical protein